MATADLLHSSERGRPALDPFDPARLRELASLHRTGYATAAPFPHAVLDDFLPLDVAERLLEEFPHPRTFRSESSLTEPRRWGKLRSTGEESFSPFARSVLRGFCEAPFLAFVSSLTGKPGLLSDGDTAGSLRHYGRGARLGVHADGNFHPRLQAFRRVNLILYLNHDWHEAHGGQLELWDERMSGCVKRIAPAFNRAILFDVHDTAYHGFPDPIRCPRGTTRKSVQFYYYTAEAPDGSVQPHGTIFHWRASDRWDPYRLVQGAYQILRRRRAR